MRQTSDQLVNFRALRQALDNLSAENARLRQELDQAKSDIGRLRMKEFESTTSTSSGGANAVTVTVNFGPDFTNFAETVVTGQSWVTLTGAIAVTPLAPSGDNVEVAVHSFQPVISDPIPGDGFTLSVFAPYEARGTYDFLCVGV